MTNRDKPQYISPALLLIASITLSGCSTVPPEIAATPEPVATQTQPESTAKPAQKQTKEPELTEDVLYKLLVAEIAGQRGSLELATENYMELAREIKDAGLAERATRIMIYSRKNEKALEAAQIWVKYAPENPEARQILAAMYIRNKKPEEAYQQLEQLLARNPDETVKAMQLLASFINSQEDKQTALKVMERFMATRQEEPGVMFAYAMLTLRAGEIDKAKSIMQQVIALKPEEKSYHLVYLSILEKEGDKQVALSYLEKLIKDSPEDLDLRIAYGRSLADLGRYDDAIKTFGSIVKSHPENTDAHYALGLLYLQTNRAKQAKEQFEFLISKKKLVNESSYYLGQIADYEKRFEDSITWYQAVDTNDSNFFDAQIKIALAMSRLDRIEEARAQLEKTSPQNDQQKLQLTQVEAEMLIEEDKLEDAMQVYTEAISDGQDSALLYSRAMLAEKMDRLDQFEADLLKVIEEDPDNADVLNALGYTLADRTNRYEEAYKYIKRALELSPNNFYILDSMGWVLYRMGRFDESIDYLKRAKELNDDPEVAAHLGEVLWFYGDKDEARAVLNNALKSTPEHEKLLEVFDRLKL